MKNSSLTIPPMLVPGDTIGICTPSMPAYALNNEVFDLGIKNLQSAGYKVKLGKLTEKRAAQGYRSASGRDRAAELMDLFLDKSVKGIMSTIGGMNSSSLIPYLDFKLIKQNPKVFCGYSDITSLHLSLMKHAELATFYGPGLMPHWCEYPNAVADSVNSFTEAMKGAARELKPFSQWSNHRRDWQTKAWKNIPRTWQDNQGWKILNSGRVIAHDIVVCNLSTLMSAAGTDYFPDLEGKVLLIEEMDAPLSKEERSFRQLQLMGVFDRISGLIMGKPENLNLEGAPFSLDELLMEVLSNRPYPIISNFDCAHTIPMHTIRQHSKVSFNARGQLLESIKLE